MKTTAATPMPQEGLLTTREAAGRLGLSDLRAIRAYIKNGRLKACRLPGGQYRIHPADLKALQGENKGMTGLPGTAAFDAIINASKAEVTK